MKSFKYLIEHQCPQCGAPAVLEETERLFSCEFCKVKSYLLGGKYFRYMLPNNAPEDKELVFMPYWRFKGMVFSCFSSGIRDRIVDISQQAIESRYFPFSLGFRSQVLKLRFVTSDTSGHFLKPRIPISQVKENFGKRTRSTPLDPLIQQEYIGESQSLIYSPFYINSKVYDAVLNEPCSSELPENFHIDDFPGGKPDGNISFIASLCPECGWDLRGNRESLVMDCKNCNSMWYPSKGSFKKIKFGHLPADNGEVTFFPFWRIRADVSGIDLDSYSDLIKIANLPRYIRGKNQDRDFFFWALAFKIRPRFYLNFGCNVTIAQPEQVPKEQIPDAHFHPVTLPATEAVESLKMTLAKIMKPRKFVQELLPKIDIVPRKVMLVYIPFKEGHHEFINSKFQMALHKNLLSMAENL